MTKKSDANFLMSKWVVGNVPSNMNLKFSFEMRQDVASIANKLDLPPEEVIHRIIESVISQFKSGAAQVKKETLVKLN